MPHYSPWRRLNWRYRCSPILLLFAPFGAAQVVSIITWLLPTWHDTPLAAAARWLWLAFAVLQALIMAFTFLILFGLSLPAPRSDNGPHPSMILYMSLTGTAIAVALAIGRIDLAAVCAYGSTALWSLSSCLKERRWRQLPSAIMNASIAVAVPLKSTWIAIGGLILEPLVKRVTRPDWADSVARKPTQTARAQEIQKHFKDYPHRNSSDWLLKELCDLEQWDEAAKEYGRLQRSNDAVLHNRLLRARISAGQQRYEEVYHLLTDADLTKCDELALFVAKIYAQQGQAEKAREILAKVGQCRTIDKSGQQMLGDVYVALGDYERALPCYEKAAQNTRNRHILGGMAATLMALKEYKTACFLFTQTLISTPYIARELLLPLVECARLVGDERTALKAERLLDAAE